MKSVASEQINLDGVPGDGRVDCEGAEPVEKICSEKANLKVFKHKLKITRKRKTETFTLFTNTPKLQPEGKLVAEEWTHFATLCGCFHFAVFIS